MGEKGRWWAALPALFVLCTASACGSSAGHGAQVSTSSSSTDSTARFKIVYSLNGPATPVMTASGVIDFARSRGSATLFQPVGGGTSTSMPKTPPTEMRWIGDASYTSIDPGIDVPGFSRRRGIAWTETDNLKVEQASPCHSALGIHYFVPYTPGLPTVASAHDVLDALRKAGNTVSQAGPDSIGGVATTRWQITRPHPAPRPAACTATGARATFTVWTDAQQRIRRWQTTVTTPPVSLDPHLPPKPRTTSVTTTDLYDFGVGVDVEAPPANTVYDETAENIALEAGTGTVDAAAWRDAAHGTVGGKPWTVYTATTTTGWRCVDSVGTPTPGLQSTFSSGALPAPKHDGRVADCEPAIGFLDAPRFDALIDTADGDRFVVVGTVASDVKKTQLNFSAGPTTTLVPAPENGLVQWTGPAGRRPISLTTDGDTCLLSAPSPSPRQPPPCGGAAQGVILRSSVVFNSTPLLGP